MVTGRPSPPRDAPSLLSRIGLSIPTARHVHRMLLTYAFALSASQFAHKKKSLRICTSMHSGGLELSVPVVLITPYIRAVDSYLGPIRTGLRHE